MTCDATRTRLGFVGLAWRVLRNEARWRTTSTLDDMLCVKNAKGNRMIDRLVMTGDRRPKPLRLCLSRRLRCRVGVAPAPEKKNTSKKRIMPCHTSLHLLFARLFAMQDGCLGFQQAPYNVPFARRVLRHLKELLNSKRKQTHNSLCAQTSIANGVTCFSSTLT